MTTALEERIEILKAETDAQCRKIFDSGILMEEHPNHDNRLNIIAYCGTTPCVLTTIDRKDAKSNNMIKLYWGIRSLLSSMEQLRRPSGSSSEESVLEENEEDEKNLTSSIRVGSSSDEEDTSEEGDREDEEDRAREHLLGSLHRLTSTPCESYNTFNVKGEKSSDDPSTNGWFLSLENAAIKAIAERLLRKLNKEAERGSFCLRELVDLGNQRITERKRALMFALRPQIEQGLNVYFHRSLVCDDEIETEAPTSFFVDLRI